MACRLRRRQRPCQPAFVTIAAWRPSITDAARCRNRPCRPQLRALTATARATPPALAATRQPAALPAAAAPPRDLCYNCTLVCVAPYAELGSLSTTLPASLRLDFGYGEEAVAAEVSPEGEGGASEGASPPRYLSPLSQHERELLAPLDAPTDEFGGSFALIRVTAVSASTEEPSGGRSAAHIADGSGLRHYVEGAAYDGTPPAIYHPMPPPARRQTPAAQISSPLPTRARFHAPTCTPPRSRLHAPIPHASLPLYPPAPRPSSLLSSTHRSTAAPHTHMHMHASRQAASWVAATRLSPADPAARGTTRPRGQARRSTPFVTRRMGWSAAGSAGAAMCVCVVHYMAALHCSAVPSL